MCELQLALEAILPLVASAEPERYARPELGRGKGNRAPRIANAREVAAFAYIAELHVVVVRDNVGEDVSQKLGRETSDRGNKGLVQVLLAFSAVH